MQGQPSGLGWLPDGDLLVVSMKDHRVLRRGSVAAEDLWFPNGMALTDDGTLIVVAETFGGRLSTFDVGADGALSGPRTFAQPRPVPEPADLESMITGSSEKSGAAQASSVRPSSPPRAHEEARSAAREAQLLLTSMEVPAAGSA